VHVFCAKCTETYTALSHLLREAAKQHNTWQSSEYVLKAYVVAAFICC
jgi:hypothetical protein